MATQNSWNNTINNAKGGITLNAGTSTINIGSDATANSINIATGAANKTVVIGNTSSTTDTTLLNGSGNIIIDKSSATGAVTIGDGTANFAINIGRGGSKTINMGAYDTTTFDIRGATIPIAGNIVTIGHQATRPTDLIVGSPVTTSTTTIYSGSSGLSINIPNAVINMNSGIGTIGISNDASATTVNVGTGAAVKTVTVGSTNSTSATTVQSGSGALNVTSTNGAITINSGTGTVGIGSDATAATYNFATGAGAKVVTLGATNSTSSLALKYGTADFTLASATGTVMSALDTGEITYPLQPAFRAFLPTTDSNATGDGTVFTLGSGNALTEVFDQGSDFVTTGTFTAPVTGRYLFYMAVLTDDTTSAHTTWQPQIRTASIQFNLCYQNGFVNNASGGFLGGNGSVFINLTAADTVTFVIVVSGGTKVVDVIGGDGLTYVGGYLVC